jgi:hypothetical protein
MKRPLIGVYFPLALKTSATSYIYRPHFYFSTVAKDDAVMDTAQIDAAVLLNMYFTNIYHGINY